MAIFAYNNAKNNSIRYMLFELNYSYHLSVFYIKHINLYSKSKTANKLTKKLGNLIIA